MPTIFYLYFLYPLMKNFSFKKTLSALVLSCLLAIGLTGCFSQKIVVGNGASGQGEETTKAWFFVFGLIPGQGPIDVDKMAKGSSNYTVVYEQTFIDGLINYFTINLVTPRTVTVKR